MAKKKQTSQNNGKPQSATPKKKSGRGKKGKGGGALVVIITALITVVIGIIVLARYGVKTPAPVVVERPTNVRELNIYSGDDDGMNLKARRFTVKLGSAEEELKAALDALVKGTGDRGTNPIPKGTRLLGVKISGGAATVNLSREYISNSSGGSTGELLAIYSIVDTVTLNYPAIKKVQLLVNGKKEETIAGHIIITYPLDADTTLIAK